MKKKELNLEEKWSCLVVQMGSLLACTGLPSARGADGDTPASHVERDYGMLKPRNWKLVCDLGLTFLFHFVSLKKKGLSLSCD